MNMPLLYRAAQQDFWQTGTAQPKLSRGTIQEDVHMINQMLMRRFP